jgi:hypothetical protein
MIRTDDQSAKRPGTAVHPSPRRHGWRAAVLWFALAAPALAAPALEYGPEAEARFRALCTEDGPTAAACQALMERLQAQLGYAAFLEAAEQGPGGFPLLASDPRVTAPTILAKLP